MRWIVFFTKIYSIRKENIYPEVCNLERISILLLQTVLGNSLAPFRFLTPFSIRSSRRLRNSLRSDILAARLRRIPCLAMAVWWKTVRKAERAWFLSGGEESEALIRVAFDMLGQKQRVLEPYSLSLSSMVAAAISQNVCLEYDNQLSWICKCCRRLIWHNMHECD